MKGNPVNAVLSQRFLGFIVGLAAAWWWFPVAAHADRSRYDVILEREPFGAAASVPAAPAPAATEPSFAQTLRISALIEDDSGMQRIGLYDEQSRNSLFIGVGEVIDGLEVLSISLEEQEAVLRKGSEIAVLQLSAGRTVAPAESSRTAAPARAQTAETRRQLMEERRQAYLERRAQRRQDSAEEDMPPEGRRRPRLQAAAAETPTNGGTRRLRGTELRQHLQEYQMEVIRQGLPPLPIPLTPEMDAQLVEEGILPPQ